MIASNNQEQSPIQIFPISLNQTDFLIIHNQTKKYKMRADSAFKRVQWLYALNIFSKNLTDDL